MRSMGEQPRDGRVGNESLRMLVLGFALLACGGCADWPPVRSLEAARYYARGTQALERGDAATAIRALERASALQPTASEIQNHLGLAYWEGSRRDDALLALERAVALDCDNRAAQANLEQLRALVEAEAAEAADGERKASHGG